MQVPLKYKITQDDIDRGKAPSGGTSGITTTTVDKTVGVSTQFTFQENGNYIPLPDSIIGVNKILQIPWHSNDVNGNVQRQISTVDE